MANLRPYGAWKSPISSVLATENVGQFQEIHRNCGSKDVIYWLEMRVDEGGRYVVCSYEADGSSGVSTWTPKEYNARTKVHEYGGGSFFVQHGTVYFSNFSDQRLYKQDSPNDTPVAITADDSGWRYADGQYCVKHKRIYSVREDHSVVEKGESKQPVNTLVAINPETMQQQVIASGFDFYASPRVSPDGTKIAWVQWNHPNMPWDSTELWMANLDESGDHVVPDSAKQVMSGTDLSILHPGWTMDNTLLYLGDQTDWWNIYHVNASGEHDNLMPINQEIGGPHWTFAHYYYDVDPTGTGNIALTFGSEIGILNQDTKKYRKLESGFDSHSLLQFSADGRYVYCEAGSPTRFSAVIQISVETGTVVVIKNSKELTVDTGYLSVPKTISWPTGDGEVSNGYLYLPQNKDFAAPEGTLPPLLVRCHGGPTGMTWNKLKLGIQYFTSRGFALLDVNYRGSTGFGKRYRHRLRGNWGVCDVEDACSGAKHLADTGVVDEKKLCIDGGSAGGYTTLACLAFTKVFSAGASHYGIADLSILAQETHKFESRYCDNMIAPLTPEFQHIYDARSPIKHVDKFSCPIAFFQGDEDKIVLPNQAEMMFNAVKEKGIPCSFVLFKGEQHGFRKAENIQKALDGEFYFFGKIFGFTPADGECDIAIYNL